MTTDERNQLIDTRVAVSQLYKGEFEPKWGADEVSEIPMYERVSWAWLIGLITESEYLSLWAEVTCQSY